MVQVWASEKFSVKSLSALQVGPMDMKIWKFHEKNEISWNFVVSQISSEIDFREGLRRQNPPGSCAARNIQDFGGATCMLHGWCAWAWCMECWSWILDFYTWMSACHTNINLIWLVETVSLNQACKAIFLYGGRGQIGRILGRFFWLEIFTFLDCARTSFQSFAFSFCPAPGVIV